MIIEAYRPVLTSQGHSLLQSAAVLSESGEKLSPPSREVRSRFRVRQLGALCISRCLVRASQAHE